MRIDAALERAIEELRPHSESPRIDAELLLARALDVARSYLFAHPEDVPDEAAIGRFFDAVERRKRGVPLAYITGEKEFWSLPLIVTPDTLVPRPETELLVELALRHIPRQGECHVLDLGTGSGAIALAIASERPNCEVTATDVSGAALGVARENASRLQLANVSFVQGDWTEPVAGRTFDLVVSNPPYVRHGDPALEALRHEPPVALSTDDDGLAAIRILARDCGALLEPGAPLLLEHGIDQADEVAGILEEHGWSGIECHNDLTGRPRATVSYRSPHRPFVS
ncbi:MAG TPA: peptide chain release factor N(5)-glutamine methyltransferase [Woeseiaceae bacterium]|nr:peptide chain release factor N(5)-glutamine methyltransferase [Woeseiaceae bacterium]